VNTKVVSRYFDPLEYRKTGSMIYGEAPVLQMSLSKFPDSCNSIQYLLSKEFIEFWESSWLQTSSFPQFFNPTTLNQYNALLKQTLYNYKMNSEVRKDWGLFDFTIGQSFEVYRTEYGMFTLDAALGLLGGYSAIIWSVLALVLSPYQSFMLDTSLIRAVYPTLPKSVVSGEAKSERAARTAMLRSVADRGQYVYDYLEHLIGSCLSCCCCL